jgi:hypothetical protein
MSADAGFGKLSPEKRRKGQVDMKNLLPWHHEFTTITDGIDSIAYRFRSFVAV